MVDSSSDLASLRTVGDYQFGTGAGEGLFPADESPTIERSRSGRPRQVISDGSRIATLLTDGRLSLGLEGGRRLDAALPHPAYRVVVGDESEPYVREGRNVFAKFVREADLAIRPADEVLVVHDDRRFLGVGRAELSADAMLSFETGMAVMVRDGESEP